MGILTRLGDPHLTSPRHSLLPRSSLNLLLCPRTPLSRASSQRAPPVPFPFFLALPGSWGRHVTSSIQANPNPKRPPRVFSRPCLSSLLPPSSECLRRIHHPISHSLHPRSSILDLDSPPHAPPGLTHSPTISEAKEGRRLSRPLSQSHLKEAPAQPVPNAQPSLALFPFPFPFDHNLTSAFRPSGGRRVLPSNVFIVLPNLSASTLTVALTQTNRNKQTLEGPHATHCHEGRVQ